MTRQEKPVTIDRFEKITGIHITTDHTGKMSGMVSLSTSVNCNSRCAENAKIPSSICQKCYAAKMAKMYPNLDAALERNTEVLTGSILPEATLPIINAAYFRFEAFGDLMNVTQIINYFNICKKNPAVRFALWTKNPDIIADAIAQGYKKPKNLVIVLSSLFINQERDAGKYADFVDKIFTVYDKQTIKAEGIEINCGGRQCITCLKCYKKNKHTHIREQLK